MLDLSCLVDAFKLNIIIFFLTIFICGVRMSKPYLEKRVILGISALEVIYSLSIREET